MTATWSMKNSGFKEERWLRMVGVSLLFHVAILSTTLFVPHGGIRYPSIEGRVYEVELVGPPSGGTRVGKDKAASTSRPKKSFLSSALIRLCALRMKLFLL